MTEKNHITLHEFNDRFVKLEEKLIPKWLMKIPPIFTILAFFILGFSYYHYHQVEIKNKQLVSTMEKYIYDLSNRIDNSDAKIKFFAIADSIITNSGSDLETAERTMLITSIWNYTRQFGVDEYMMLSLYKSESNFKKNVISNKGACGIAQFLPSTFRICAALLHEPINDTKVDIFDIDRQIKYSCFYVRMLYDDCNDYNVALTRYNAGSVNYVNDYAINIMSNTARLKR